MQRVTIAGAEVLAGDEEAFRPLTVVVEEGHIAALLPPEAPLPRGPRLDGTGLILAPGIVDLHGDAFERQMMPRPGVHIDPAVALADTDRQLVANGITTAYHGITYSWEPGLRGRESCLALIETLQGLNGRLACDTRLHLRFETYNLDGLEDALGWIAARQVDLLAFNDHFAPIAGGTMDPRKVETYAQRAGLSRDGYAALVARVGANAERVPALVARLAEAARTAGLPLMSHDDESPEMRRDYDALGCGIAEFPKTRETAAAARELGNAVVFGAPNVLRGGSHNGMVRAADMVADGLCDVLASDYYYPAPLLAPFRLAAEGLLELGAAWRLVSSNPARAAGLNDRDALAEGKRADLVLLARPEAGAPARAVATLVAGQPVHLAEGRRLAA